jgi:hypothetical protein
MGYEDWPRWLRERLDLFPEEPLASYVSGSLPEEESMPPGDVRTIQMLILTQDYLCGYELTVSQSSKHGVTGQYESHGIPLGAIKALRVKESGVIWQKDAKGPEYRATISLDRVLPPFGQEAQLAGDEGRLFIAALVQAKS